jgi:hypothetical protein
VHFFIEGGKVWDSTYILLKYLNLRRDIINGAGVFEFGSGTGLAGDFNNNL